MDFRPAAAQFQDAERDEQGVRGHVVVEGLGGFARARPAAAGEISDLDLGLGVEGDPQGVRVGRRPRPGLPEAVEDGVGLGDFFSGRASRTGRRR